MHPKKELKRRSFGKVVGEAVELLEYADYVYIFGSTKSFGTNFFFLPSVKTLTKLILFVFAFTYSPYALSTISHHDQ
jgi:hypothetical protein